MSAKITFAERKATEKIKRRGAMVLRKITAVTIERSQKMLTDWAEITLPRMALYLENGKEKINFEKANDLFRKGDAVVIELGYDGKLKKEFQGYIVEVSAGIPLKLKCQDEMYRLKNIPVNISFPKKGLKDFLAKILPNEKVISAEIKLGAMRFPGTTAAKVLAQLKEDYLLDSYFRDGVLHCGKMSEGSAKVVPIALEQQAVSNDLVYQNADDLKLKIEVVAISSNGKKVTATAGDEGGTTKQSVLYGADKKGLQNTAQQLLKEYKVDGFSGSLVCFGAPKLSHGDHIALTSEKYPERDGIYKVVATKVSFGSSGFRRTIDLGEKV